METHRYYATEERKEQSELINLPFLLTGKHKAFSIIDDSMPTFMLRVI